MISATGVSVVVLDVVVEVEVVVDCFEVVAVVVPKPYLYENKTDDEDELNMIEQLGLLTRKGVIYAANVAESDIADDGSSNPYLQKVKEYAKNSNSEVFCLCGDQYS